VKVYTISIAFCLVYSLNGQISKQAILNRNLMGMGKGDTINIFGSKLNVNDKLKYLVMHPVYKNYRLINAEHATLLNNRLRFWENVYFEERQVQHLTKGYQTELRTEIQKAEESFLQHCRQNNRMYSQEIVNEYLREVMRQIYPDSLTGLVYQSIKPYVLDDNRPIVSTFGGSAVFITTGYLAETKSEQELHAALAQQVAHIVLEHDIKKKQQEIKQENAETCLGCLLVTGIVFAAVALASNDDGTSDESYDACSYDESLEEPMVAVQNNPLPDLYIEPMPSDKKYNTAQMAQAKKYADRYVYEKGDATFKTEKEYLKIIAETVTQMAWQHYHEGQYEQALEKADRMVLSGIATEEDYLLKCRLHRLKYSSEEEMRNIIKMVEHAQSLQINPLVELDEEAALAYSRLGDTYNETEAYKRYRDGLQALLDKGEDVGNELARVNEILFRKTR
jgi:hypothetical protein